MGTMQTSKESAALAERLSAALDLQQPPVAISFADVAPEGVGGPAVRAAAGCRFWQDAAGAVFATSAEDHGLCAIGVYTHNLYPSPVQQAELMDVLKVFGDLGYVRPQDAGLIPVLKTQSKFVVYAPLAQAPLDADVVLLFVNASQTLVLTEATQQVEAEHAPAMGRPACAVVPQVMNSGRAALSLGCCGARAYLDVLTDAVAIFAIPGAKLAAYVERIEELSRANALLTKFHHLRRRDVESGGAPSIQESLAVLAAS
jgi:uncharacterized protein (DUF169 family)